MSPVLSPPHNSRIAVVPPAAAGSTTGLKTLAVVCACAFILHAAADVCIPMVLAILLAFVLSPVINSFTRSGLPRVPAILLTVLLAVAVILSLGGVIVYQGANLVRELPSFKTAVTKKVNDLQGGPIARMLEFVDQAEDVLGNVTNRQSAAKAAVETSQAGAPANPLLVRLAQSEASSLATVRTMVDYAEPAVSTAFMTLIVVVFLLLQREDLRDRMIRLFGSRDLNATTHAMNEAAHRLSVYFLAQVTVNASFGAVIATVLFLIGVPSAVLWGILAMLLRFVPYVGVALAASLPILLAAAISPRWTLAIETAALFALTEGVTGQVVEPVLYGRSTGISPFAVIASAMVWAWLWGPVGLILSTPLTVVLVVLGHHVSQLQFLDILLGDEPALTLSQSLYQRILAGDVDEARAHAEAFIGDNPLGEYYDSVAMQVLRTATNDHARGALSEESLVIMKRCLREFIADVGSADHRPFASLKPSDGQIPAAAGATVAIPVSLETSSPLWQSPGAVLCVAGHGPFDEEAAAMVVQLLGKHRVGARLVAHVDTTRQHIGALDVEGVQMACLVHIEIAGATPYLRYLVERIRARMPGRRLVLGAWAPEGTHWSGERPLNVDQIVASLSDMVTVCLNAAEPDTARTAAA